MNSDFSILIGGQAGFGIDKSSLIIGRLLNQLGYYIYIYRDYPSLIRGGHTFSIIRAAAQKIATHSNKVDFLLALNQETIDRHQNKLKPKGNLIADLVDDVGIMRNSRLLGSFCKASGIDWQVLDNVFRQTMEKELDQNLKVARGGFEAAVEKNKTKKLGQPKLPLLTGNEAISLGLISGGLKNYAAYPMTPTSTILHFLAESAEKFGVRVLQPESEIGVMLMALGFSYMNEKTAVGTSGGGFCLMTEGLSFAGQSELPITIVLGMRPGPSTGLPTYSAQTELHFALNAGQGEFSRFIVAPGDPEEAYYWSAFALNTAWKFRLPTFVLTDKNLSEGMFSFDADSIPAVQEFTPPPREKAAVVKINSYEHDEKGLTTEDPTITKLMQEKRLRKGEALAEELEKMECVKIYGNKKSLTVLLCWGSNKGVCVEVGEKLGLGVVQPLVLEPFPVKQFKAALVGAKQIICVENNATGQLVRLIKQYGFSADEKILKYDGRPFALDELEAELKKWI